MGHRIDDNSEALFNYISSNHPEIDAYFITKNRNLALSSNNPKIVYSRSTMGILLQLRASTFVYTHSKWSDFEAFLSGVLTKNIQLWHGFPIKRIGFDSPDSNYRKVRYYLKLVLKPYNFERHDLVTAVGDYDRRVFQSAFSVTPEKVLKLGYARNDRLLLSSNEAALEKGDTDIRLLSSIRFLLAPSFRGGGESSMHIVDMLGDMSSLHHTLGERNSVLRLRLHPVQRQDALLRSVVSSSTRVEIPSNSLYDDIAWSDVVITDVSGTFFDALYAGRRVCGLFSDQSRYEDADRGTYLPLSNFFNEWMYPSLQEILIAARESASFGKIDVCQFATYRDASACKRITMEIKRMHGSFFHSARYDAKDSR